MNLFYTFTNFFIGSCLASHACVIYQRSNQRDFIFARSQCDNCHFELSLLDELPLISFLLLKGRCRYCKQEIPTDLFFFELLGGFCFCSIDFSNHVGILTAILLFSLLLVTISDYNEKEFNLLWLTPALLVVLIHNQLSSFQLIDWFSFLLMIFIFSWNIFKRKIGLGDLLVYLIIALYFTPAYANLVFLIASILLIFIYLIEKRQANYQHPFIPYIFMGLIIAQFV